MEILKKYSGTMLLLAALLFTGCGKEKKEDPIPENSIEDPNPQNPVNASDACKPIKFISGNVEYNFVYNSAGQITKTSSTPFNSRLSPYYESVKYNSAGNIEKVNRYSMPGNKGLQDQRVYTYSSNGLLILEIIYQDSLAYRELNRKDFEYDAAKRLVKVKIDGNSITYNYFPDGRIQENLYYGDFGGPGPTTLRESRVYEFAAGKSPWGNVAFFKLQTLGYSSRGQYTIIDKLPQRVVCTYYTANPGTATFGYSYTFNKEGYPLEQVTTYEGRYSGNHSWTYTCQ